MSTAMAKSFPWKVGRVCRACDARYATSHDIEAADVGHVLCPSCKQCFDAQIVGTAFAVVNDVVRRWRRTRRA